MRGFKGLTMWCQNAGQITSNNVIPASNLHQLVSELYNAIVKWL